MSAVVEADGLPVVAEPRSKATRNIVEALVIGVILTAVSYIIGFAAGWLSGLSMLEVFAVFTSYASTYLCVRERRANYVFGAISTAAYSVLFFGQGLYASALLNAYLAPSLVYGWFRWRKDADTRPVGTVGWKWYPVYIAVTGAAYFGAVLLFGALGASMAWADGFILILTILAQFLLDNKKIETWVVWFVVNVFAIYVYATSGLALVAFQYVFFLLNTGYGFYEWRKSMKRSGLDPKHLVA